MSDMKIIDSTSYICVYLLTCDISKQMLHSFYKTTYGSGPEDFNRKHIQV